MTNEQLWTESADTAKGREEHQQVHTTRIEKRGNEIKLYEYSVFSDTLGISGKCDCIEAFADPSGCMIPGVAFPVRLYPVEYKHGKVRSEEEYEIQLCAQAVCLEEMFHTEISEGAVFYITSHRRLVVPLTAELRDRVRETISKLDLVRRTFSVPAAEYGPKCNRCSIREACMPQLPTSARKYCNELEKSARETEIS